MVQLSHAPSALLEQFLHALSEARFLPFQQTDDAGDSAEPGQQQEGLGGVGGQLEADLGQQLVNELHDLDDQPLRPQHGRKPDLDEGGEVGVQEARHADDVEDLQHALALKVVLNDPAEDLQHRHGVVC